MTGSQDVCGQAPATDTPSLMANPRGLRDKIPRLAAQPEWTEFASPEQIALYDGPQTVYPTPSKSEYSLEGFNTTILGSEVPPPGTHPRLFFSPDDVPGLRARYEAAPAGQRYLADLEATVSHYTFHVDNEQFWELAKGNPDGKLSSPDPFAGPNGNHNLLGECRSKWMHSSHVPQIPFQLTNAAMYCLIFDDAEKGAAVGRAIATYFLLREPYMDAHIKKAEDPANEDSWPDDLWRGWNLVVGQAHIALSVDFAGKWMSPEDLGTMHRLIGRATKGRRAYGQNGPPRWRDTNWVGWDLEHNLAAMVVEGTEHADPDLYPLAVETLEYYFTYGFSPSGTILETNGKNDGGLLVAMSTALACARRGDNLLGHPHFRKMTDSQVFQVTPNGETNTNNGTYGCTEFRLPGHFLALYPESRSAAYLLRQLNANDDSFDLVEYRKTLENARAIKRLPWPEGSWGLTSHWGPVVESGGAGKLPRWSRDFIGCSLDFEDPVHGLLSSRSSTDVNGVYLFFEARADKMTVGHEHHDAGHFYIASHGTMWGFEGDHGLRDSCCHSVVLIDGRGQGSTQHCSPACVKWLGAELKDTSARASADLKHGYGYVWSSPMHYSWTNEERESLAWEPEVLPQVVDFFRGTQFQKARKWMSDYWNWGWGPTMRAAYNPVEYAFRSVGLVRGEHAYVIVVDDVKKDENAHYYEWQMQVKANIGLACNKRVLPEGLTVLAKKEDLMWNGLPKKGSACLGMYSLQQRQSCPPTDEQKTYAVRLECFGGEHWRVVVPHYGVSAGFKYVLAPFVFEDAMPRVEPAGADGRAVIWWEAGKGKERGQEDTVTFQSSKASKNQTSWRVERDGCVIAG